jgi:hypothetical protein
MTSYDPNLVRLIRTIVNGSIAESKRKTKIPGTLSGVVEDLDSDLDVVYVRMDQEATQSDPTVSDNYDFPGVVAVNRLGETFIDETVRVTFDAISATASAMRTGVENKIVLPFGTEEGQRIILDGNEGAIGFFAEDDQLVGFLDALQWFVGSSGTGLVRIDPVGGLRVWDINDKLRVSVGAEDGLQVREPVSGVSGVTARHDGIIIADPSTGETISISSGQTSSVPAPHWASLPGTSATTTHATPAINSFKTGDDLDLRFVAASSASALGAQSYTAPGSYTELADVYESGAVSLGTSVASRDPAITSPGVANFTSSTSTFTRRIGHSVIIRGGGGTSPTVSAVEPSAVQTFEGKTITTTFEAPPGVVDGELVIAHVAWAVPAGWIQLGVQSAGVGTSHILGSGIWYKAYQTGDPLEETVVINMNAVGTTKVQAMIATVADPYRFPVGLDIRRNNISMPRGKIAQAIATTTEPSTGATFTVSDLQLPNVELLAGRTYSIHYHEPNVAFELSSSAPGRWDFLLEKDGVRIGSFGSIQLVTTSAAAYRLPLDSTIYYTPVANETVDFTVVAEESDDGMTCSLVGAATQQRAFTIMDLGANY